MLGIFGLIGTIRTLLKGSKTYAVAVALLLCVVVEKYLGWDVPGFSAPENWLGVVMAAFGLASVRAGVSEAVKQITNFNK